MANPEHVEILKRGADEWNKWLKSNSVEVSLREADLRGVDLRKADLHKADLTGADLRWAHLDGANLRWAHLDGANLRGADLRGTQLAGAQLAGADLRGTQLRGVDLSWAILRDADLRKGDLCGVDLRKADLRGTDLSNTDLSKADLRGANLERAILVETNFEDANISGCRIFGISAWKLKIKNLIQSNLIITDEGEPEITVDKLEIAQFVYLLLNNEKLRDVIDTLTTKSVLILGRFTTERKAVLDAIREELRKHDYVPMLFDFERPVNRNFSETVMTLASLSRFVIVDLSDPNSAPYEVLLFAERLRSVPLQAIFCPTPGHLNPFPMYEDLQSSLSNVLPIYRYETLEALIASLTEKVIEPAEAKVNEVRPKAL